MICFPEHYGDWATKRIKAYDLSKQLPPRHRDREWFQTFKYYTEKGYLGEYIRSFSQEHFGVNVIAVDYDGVYYLPRTEYTSSVKYVDIEHYMITVGMCPACGCPHAGFDCEVIE